MSDPFETLYITIPVERLLLQKFLDNPSKYGTPIMHEVLKHGYILLHGEEDEAPQDI